MSEVKSRVHVSKPVVDGQGHHDTKRRRASRRYEDNNANSYSNGAPAVTPELAPLGWGPDCRWLDGVWEIVFRDDPARVWRIAMLINPGSPLDLRDGAAGLEVRERLAHRERVEKHFYQAWSAVLDDDRPANRDYIFIGRPRLFLGGASTPLVHPLAARALGKFEEAPNGGPATALRYGDVRFAKAEVDEGHRRVERDFGVFVFRRHVDAAGEHWLVSIGGITWVATWALAWVLVDADARAEFADQVRALLPPGRALRFDESFEICCRFEVDQNDWDNLANAHRFEFQVEVVVAGAEPPCFRTGPVDLVLRSHRGRRRGDLVAGQRQVRLAPRRYALVRRLIEQPQGVPVEDLLDEFQLVSKGVRVRAPGAPRATSEQREKADGAVRKLVYDVNDQFEELSPGWRPVLRIDGRYVLEASARVEDADE